MKSAIAEPSQGHKMKFLRVVFSSPGRNEFIIYVPIAATGEYKIEKSVETLSQDIFIKD